MRSPSLQELPPSPDKQGWPWTQENAAVWEDGIDWPKISVIIPSYQQAPFLEINIRSVLLQGYPRLELLVMDGGSTDGSVDVIKKYEPWITRWVSEKDKGQSDALNKGFRLSTGSIIGWQNSDDYYYPGAFIEAARLFLQTPEIDVVHGSVCIVDEHNQVTEEYPTHEATHDNLLPMPQIYNQAMFFKKASLNPDRLVNESYHHCMDYDLFWELMVADKKFVTSPKIKAAFRKHQNTKSNLQIPLCWKELFIVYAKTYRATSDPILKSRLRHEMIQNTLNCWGHRLYPTLHEQTRVLDEIFGFTSIPLKIHIQSVLSYFLR